MEPQSTQTRPSPDPVARILAVVALLVGATVLVVVIAGSTGSSDEGSEQGRGGPGADRAHQSYCVVRAGDTFAAIAARAGVPETRLAELNPNLDQFSIQPQNCVNLIPEGCKKLAGGGPPNPCT
jgi:LysM repeat protein